jgi:hypothetical protein
MFVGVLYYGERRHLAAVGGSLIGVRRLLILDTDSFDSTLFDHQVIIGHFLVLQVILVRNF